MTISKEDIKKIDALYWNVEERASGVHSILMEAIEKLPPADRPTTWDVFCFAVEYVAMISVVLESEEVTLLARELIKYLYSAHYSAPEVLYGKPDREPLGDEGSGQHPKTHEGGNNGPL